MDSTSRATAGVASVTAASGVAHIFDWVQTGLGVVATAVGIVVALVMLRNNHRNARAQYEKTRLEIQMLQDTRRREARRRATDRWRDGHEGEDGAPAPGSKPVPD